MASKAPKPCKFTGSGGIHGPKPYKFIGLAFAAGSCRSQGSSGQKLPGQRVEVSRLFDPLSKCRQLQLGPLAAAQRFDHFYQNHIFGVQVASPLRPAVFKDVF